MSTTEIIVINWNNRAETLECIAAVEAQLRDVAGASITVVDNGSSDGSATAIASKHPNVKLFALKENRGFTGGIAAALAGSVATNVVFLNNDAVPEPGWLAALVHAIDNAPGDVLSIGGRIVDPTGTKIDFIGGMLTFDGHAFQNGFRYPVGSREEPKAGDEILFACGGNMISRRAPLMELAELLETESVYFLPYQPREVLPQSLSSADLHVVGLARGLSGYVVPSRLYGIMAVGRPVVVAAAPEEPAQS
jgi:GT2 family glycosyltransferase